MAVIDEAHRLRNVYKPGNRIANSIKAALAEYPKILLTATPLQNSLMELYGLVSVVDEYCFSDLASFRAQFGDLSQSPRTAGNYAATLAAGKSKGCGPGCSTTANWWFATSGTSKTFLLFSTSAAPESC